MYLSEGRINFVMNQKDSFLVGAANGNIDMEVGSGTLWSVTDDSIFKNLRPTVNFQRFSTPYPEVA